MSLRRALGDDRARLRRQLHAELDLDAVGLQRPFPEHPQRGLGGGAHALQGALEGAGRLHRPVAAGHQPGTGPPLRARFDSFAIVDAYRATAVAHGTPVPPQFGRLVSRARRIRELLTGPEHTPVPCHNDLLNANFIHDGERVRIVDWEYAGMGDRFFDLGNLSVNNGFSDGDDEALLAAYFGEPCTDRRFAALRLMRIMSDFREGMWGVVQRGISELDFDFAAYADEHLTRVGAAMDDPRFETWLEAARGAEP